MHESLGWLFPSLWRLEMNRRGVCKYYMEALINHLLRPIVGKRPKAKVKISVPWTLKFIRVYFRIAGRLFPRLVARQGLDIFGTTNKRYTYKTKSTLVAQAERFSVSSEGLQIHGYIWDNQGPTVLLVHGWETGGLHLGAFVEPLWALGFRIVTFDGPAHGASEGTYTNIPHFAKALLRVMEETGPVSHLISHSFGGVVSVFLAAHQPERVKLKKLVLINVPNKLVRILGEFASHLGLGAAAEREMLDLIRKRFHMEPEHMEISRLGHQMKVEALLVVHDRKDSIVPFYNGLEITHALPKAQLLPCENLGHNRILKHPQVINRIGRFLSQP